MKREEDEEDEELEEFEEEDEEEELPSLKKQPEKKKPAGRIPELPAEEEDPEEHFRKAVQKQQQEQEEPQEKIQYVPVPRAVPIENMLNEIYDRQENLLALIQQLRKDFDNLKK